MDSLQLHNTRDPLPECIFFDMDADGHIGVLDFAVLQIAFTGEASAAR